MAACGMAFLMIRLGQWLADKGALPSVPAIGGNIPDKGKEATTTTETQPAQPATTPVASNIRTGQDTPIVVEIKEQIPQVGFIQAGSSGNPALAGSGAEISIVGGSGPMRLTM